MIIPIIKQVPPECIGGKILYCSDQGTFFSAKGRELKPHFNSAMRTRKYTHGGAYPTMVHFANRLCHHLVWETFVGPRIKGLEIDHINGDKLNWSLTNLQEVTPAENRKRAKILRILRSNGLDPKQMTRAELLAIFNKYTIVDPEILDKYEPLKHI